MKCQDLSQAVAIYVITRSQDELNRLTRHKIADVVGINPNYLSQKFKEDTGRALMEFINFEKMKRAEKALIICQKMTVTDISEIVGFAKYNQFRETFKKTFGVNPRVYRKARNNPGAVEQVKQEHLCETIAIYIITRLLNQLTHLSHNRISLDFSMNKNYLGDIFRKGVKRTVSDFILFEKIKRAENMLIDRHDLTIKAIAQSIGLPDCSRFRKKFKKFYGLPPCQYRLLYKT